MIGYQIRAEQSQEAGNDTQKTQPEHQCHTKDSEQYPFTICVRVRIMEILYGVKMGCAMTFFSSIEYCLSVRRRIFRAVASTPAFDPANYGLICDPFGHYDEQEVLPHAPPLNLSHRC